MPAGSKGDLKRIILQQNKIKYNGISIFQLPRETKIGSKDRRDMFEKLGVKLQCSTIASSYLKGSNNGGLEKLALVCL